MIGGIRGITTGVANAIPVVIDSNGQLGTVSSSIRFKEDVHDMADVSRRLMKLRPVTFRYTQAYRDGAKPIQYGLIAETQTAPAFAGSGASLTGVAKLAANTFTGTQTIFAGNLELGQTFGATSGNITKEGELFLHDFGNQNTFLGRRAGSLGLGGVRNTGTGVDSLKSVTTGESNTANGARALSSNTSGESNTAIGDIAMALNTTGFSNTAIGGSALFAIQEGHDNVAVGTRAGAFALGSNNIYLGALVEGLAGESNTMYLGKVGTQTRTFIAGVRGITTGTANAIPVVIDSNGQLGTVSSSIRFKEDIHDMADVSRRLMKLRPVTFRYTQAYGDGAKPIQYGLIAEEVADVFPELAVRGADGQVETVHYETLNVLLLNEFQKQEGRLEALEQQLNEL